MSVVSVCASCQASIAEGSRFCASCGAPISAPASAEVRKTVTLLFCDVSGSTAMGEQLDPEALRAAMGRYFDTASAAVERHGGTVEKFVGDAVLAVFGIPEVREDDALRAVRAADDMRVALGALSDELLTTMDVRLAVRTGVNTGSVVAGTARAGGSFATGDAVNTAARLEQAAAPGEVLIGASTLSLVRDAVEVEAVEPLSVKGKAEPLPAYRLIRVFDTDRGRNRRMDATLVGREREWRVLTESLARAKEDERSQLITVLGNAGMGKTRLIDQFLGDLDADVRVLRGRCLSYGRGITFWPVVQLLRQAADLTGDEDDDTARGALSAALAGCSDAPAVAERLLPLMGYGGEPGGTDETFWAVRTFFEHLATSGPVVVAIDDLHWAESTLLDLVERIRDDVRDVPLLVVCQARPELLEQRPGWGGGAINALTFNLEPFTSTQTGALLEGVLGSGVPSEVVDAVDAWAGGNPLFVEEVAGHLVESNILVRLDEGWSISGDLASAAVPSTVSALLAARLERLPADERSLVERIAVVGLEVTTDEAVDLSPDTSDVPKLLASLTRRDVLRRTRGGRPDTWAFRHVLVREAAYEALPKAVRADLHERFADRLAKGSADAGSEAAAFIGHHLEQAAQFRQELAPGSTSAVELAARAVDALAEAATQARDSGATPAARGLVDRALKLAPEWGLQRRDLLWLRSDLEGELGIVTEASATNDEIIALLDETSTASERAVCEVRSLQMRLMRSEPVDPAELAAAADKAADLARAEGDTSALVRALRSRGDAGVMRAQWELVVAGMAEILAVGSPADRRGVRAGQVAAHVWGPRPVEEGLAFVEPLIDAPGVDVRARCFMQVTRAALLAKAGRSAEAHEVADQAERLLAEIDPRYAATTAFFTVQIHICDGNLPAAIDVLVAGIEDARALGGLAFASTLIAWRAALLLEQGGQDALAAQITEEAAAVTSPYDAMSVGLLETCRAVLAARAGDHDRAGEHLSAAVDAMKDSDQDGERADLFRRLSEVPARRGDTAEQRRLLTDALALFRKKGDIPLTARTEQMIAEVPD